MLEAGDSPAAVSSESVPPSSASCSPSAAAGAVSQPHSSPAADMAEDRSHHGSSFPGCITTLVFSMHEIPVVQICCQYLRSLGSLSISVPTVFLLLQDPCPSAEMF